MDPTAYAIAVEGISKRFGPIQALSDVQFTVPRESVFCLLGPNGAGKTTLLKILTTITRPDTGTAWIEGNHIADQVLGVRQLIGVVAQENRFDRYLTIWHNLTLHAQMHGLPRSVYEPRVTELLEKVGLYARRFDLADELSGGMQRRVALIRALIHRPRVLFLDEPTTGLDPQARLEIWQTIEQFKQSATVILTTHYMEEADRLSDHIMLLHHGRQVAQGTPRELKQSLSVANRYVLELKNPVATTYLEQFQTQSAENGLHQVILLNPFSLALHLNRSDALAQLVSQVHPEDFLRIGQQEANLEDVFLSVTGPTAQESA